MIKYPEPNWRNLWQHRRIETRFSGYRAANRYIERKRKETRTDDLYIDVHPKDGFVVYRPAPVQLDDQYKVLPEKIVNAESGMTFASGLMSEVSRSTRYVR